MGGSNLTNSNELNKCGNSDNDVEYSGNSEAPPDPQSGGLVLVGGGTITPLGTVPWSGTILGSGTAQVNINSNSTNCPPSSAGVNVQTTYRFFDPRNSGANWFGVQRVFDFTETAFPHDFRPYIARLSLGAGYRRHARGHERLQLWLRVHRPGECARRRPIESALGF